MKRYVICTFSIAFWFLVFSTVFSIRVEQLMIPVVTECSPSSTQGAMELRLELDCLFEDEDGFPVLYQSYEGLDWDAGTRVKKVMPTSYSILEDRIQCGALENVIQYSTKELRPGEKIAITDSKEVREDIYLAVCPSGVRLREDIPESVTILCQTDTALLAGTAHAPALFMSKYASEELFQSQPFSLPDERVYSLGDIEDFFSALPLAALLPGILLFVLLLWIFSFPLLKSMKKNRNCLLLRCALAVLVLPATWFLLRFLNLPSSLLPNNNIVSVSHYSRIFSEIFSALRFFADAGVSAADASLAHAYKMMWLALGVVLLCAFSATIVLLLCRVSRRIKE